jgi:hypothetical protein
MEKADGNFKNEFRVDKLGDTKVYIGSLPQNEFDIQHLNHLGITGVINLLCHEDM